MSRAASLPRAELVHTNQTFLCANRLSGAAALPGAGLFSEIRFFGLSGATALPGVELVLSSYVAT